MGKLVAALCVLPALVGCGSTHVAVTRAPLAVVRPAHPVWIGACHQSHRIDGRPILGRTVGEANAMLKRWGCFLREAETDGKPNALTADAVGNRVDVATEDRRVVRIIRTS
jgi:hypothetical protein